MSKEEYYKEKDGEIIRYDGTVIKDILKELNYKEHFRLYHKNKRAEAEYENKLLWNIFYGFQAYLKLKMTDKIFDIDE